MERYIGMDVHAASCTLAVISETESYMSTESMSSERNRDRRLPAGELLDGRHVLGDGGAEICDAAVSGALAFHTMDALRNEADASARAWRS